MPSKLHPVFLSLVISSLMCSSAFSAESETILRSESQTKKTLGLKNEDASAAKPHVETGIATVNVSAKLKPVQIDLDRKVYNVSGDLQSTSGSAADALNAIPSVQVDGDGNVALRGDSKVLILIDGKPSSQLSGSNAGAGLLQYSASDIEKIEVMTNAPAEFAAEGTAGVINIISKRNRQPGSSGSFALNAGNQGRFTTDLNATRNTDNLSISGGIGLRNDQRQRDIISSTITQGQNGGLDSDSAENLHESARRLIPSLKGAISYRIDDAQSINFDMRFRQRSGDRNYDSQIISTLSNDTISNQSFSHSDGHEWSLSGEQRVNYKTLLSSPEKTFALTLHRSTDKERESYLLNTHYQIPFAQIGGNQITQNHYFITNDVSADYRNALAEGQIFKFGYSLRRDNNGLDFSGSEFNQLYGMSEPVPTLNNRFDYQQTIQAIYGSYQRSFGALDVLAGLRGEYTQSEGDQITSNQSTRQNYAGLYPSLHLEKQLNPHAVIYAAYSRRVSRPDPEDLNPYIDFRDPQNLQSGNPHLKPQQSQSLEVGYKLEKEAQNFAISAYAKQIKDGFTILTSIVAPDVQLTQKSNLPLSKSAGFELLADGPLSRTLSYRFSSNLFYAQVNTSATDSTLLQSMTGANMKASLDYKPTAIDTAQVSFSRTDKQLTPQGYVAALNLVNIGYKRQLQPNLSIVFTISDLFNGQRQIRYFNTPQFQRNYERFQYGRIAYVGFSYIFGAAKKSKADNFDYDQ